MGAAPFKRTQEKRLVAEVAKAIADGLVEGKNKQEIVEELIKGGLGQDEAWEWVSRVLR